GFDVDADNFQVNGCRFTGAVVINPAGAAGTTPIGNVWSGNTIFALTSNPGLIPVNDLPLFTGNVIAGGGATLTPGGTHAGSLTNSLPP
ncbi:unnamed protein product, partial [marine sediment metagenome]